MKLPLALALWLNLFLFTVPEPPIPAYVPSCAMVTGPVESCDPKCACRVGL